VRFFKIISTQLVVDFFIQGSMIRVQLNFRPSA